MQNVRMTLAATALAAVSSLGGNALAADMNAGGMKDAAYASMPPAWSGFYIGLNGGYGQNATSQDITGYVDGTAIATSSGYDTRGAFGGAQAGYNVQRDRFVFGIETDLQLAALQSTKDVPTNVVELTRHIEQNVDWFGTVRGKAGVTFGNALVYGTGGFAYAGINSTGVVSLLSAVPVAHWSRNAVETGYVAGGGLEYLINPAWTVKAEYQYLDLGSASLSGTSILGPISTNELDNKFHTVRLGFNYRLGGGMADMPLK